MLVLAVDTSGRDGSLALARGDCHSFELLELLPLAGRMYSAQLLPQLDLALERHQLSKQSLEGFAVASGPGSFTGLRVGLSTVKALGEILQKPIAPVSVLEAAARMTNRSGSITVAFDAGRSQLFVGDFELNENFSVRSRRERLLPVAEWLESRKLLPAEATFTNCDGLIQFAAAQGVVIQKIEAPTADIFAKIGIEKLIAAEGMSPGEVEPNYIRSSDAELFWHPKLTS